MSFTLSNAITMTRKHLKDDTENVWTNSDITDFINEGILIIKNTVPEYFTTLIEVVNLTDVILIDAVYKNLIPLFASARCFEQDEQNYRAVQKMNEFETRRTEMEQKILNSDAYNDIINGDSGEYDDSKSDHVIDVYFNKSYNDVSELDP